jgi:hypothetical protein
MSIWAREFWKSYWIALQRTGRDKRARSIALRITFLLAYLFAYVLFVFFMEVNAAAGQGIWNAAFYAFIFGTGTIAAILMRRWHRKQDELLNYSLTGRSPLRPQDVTDASPELRAYLEERALIVASLLARAASEIYLQHNQLSPGLEVVTRQTQNALLRENGLWNKLEQAEADLVSAADGRWSVEQQNQVFVWCEQLRLLRWVIGLDSELVPLAHFPTLDFSLSRDILRRGKSQSGKPILKSWDIRVQRDVAMEYTARVVAEFKGRGLIADSPELEGWADEFRAQSLGDSTDYLAGARTIGELDDDALRRLGSFAAARDRYCAYLVDLLNAVHPFPFPTWAG